jgi:DNA repair exonuclease SbcCD ATPase subunit
MIKFKTVRFKNFGSFGNIFTELQLNKNATTLICGNNGSGKSFAFLDSITFGLFGKPFRKINIPQIVNSINNKQCLVEIEFSKGTDEYLVRRGLNPKIFEIFKNTILLNQDAKSIDYQDILEDQILKMNYKTFTQVVILGSSSFVPFMQLNAADRRSVIENILDINIFTSMNVLLKGRILQFKETIRELNSRIETEKQKIIIQQGFIDTLQKKSTEDIKLAKDKVAQLNLEIVQLDTEISVLESDINLLEIKIVDKAAITSSIQNHNTLKTKIDSKLRTLVKDVTFFTNNVTCPSCSQQISQELKEKELQKSSIKQEEYEAAITDLTSNIEKFNSRIEDINVILKDIQDKKMVSLQKKTSKENTKKYLIEATKEIEKANYSTEQINIELGKKYQQVTTLSELESQKEEYRDEVLYFEYANELLKDNGVKSKIINYYLPHINKYINQFLSSMDFFAQFTLDEDFNEKIKSRHRDEFSYTNFSEGEKLRIDLALLLAWREIARAKNSVNCNLLILDEVFDSSLDSVGMDELMKLLTSVGDKSNIFVISHKSDQLVDKFQNLITFEKKNNFSRML